MNIVIWLLFAISMLSLAASIWTLVYLRKAVRKEHEHIQKLFKTVWKLKDHLQKQFGDQFSSVKDELAGRFKKIVSEVADLTSKEQAEKMLSHLQNAVAKEINEARMALKDFLAEEIKKIDAKVDNRVSSVTKETSGILATIKRAFSRKGAAADNKNDE